MVQESEIEVLPLSILQNDLSKEVNSLMSQCIEKNKVPYIQDKPYVQDMNVVSGFHLGDVNKIILELNASLLDCKSLKWIFGSDAALVGLELKEGQKPVTMLANINRGKQNIIDSGTSTEAQTVYLLEQFTDNSIEKALSLTQTESRNKTEKQKKIIVQNMLKNITEYDSGKNEIELRENKRKNISVNVKNKEILEQVSTAYSNITKYFNDSQKLIFGILNNYFIKQETGLSLQPSLTSEQEKAFLSALKETASASSPRLIQTLTNCFLYSQRMTHYSFAQDRIYAQEDFNKNLHIHSPEASRFKPYEKPEHDIHKELHLEREMEMKPRQIIHTLGGR